MISLFIKYKGSFSGITKAIILFLFAIYSFELGALITMRLMMGSNTINEKDSKTLKLVYLAIIVLSVLVFFIYNFVIAQIHIVYA